MPSDGVVADHVSKEPRDVAQTVGFITVDRVIIFGERSLKQVRPEPVDLGESLTDQAVKFGVCSLLRTALDDHRWQLGLQTCWQVDLHQFVAAFFKINARHNGQVDRPAKIDQVGVALVLDVHLLLLFVRFFVFFLILVFVLLLIAVFS